MDENSLMSKSVNQDRAETLPLLNDSRKHDKKNLTAYLAFCLFICAFGSSFQVGWNIGLLNTPIKTFKQFFNNTHFDKYGKEMDDWTWTLLWSITNGLMPFGAIFGGLSSGFLADYFGRKKALLIINLMVILSSGSAIISYFIDSYVPFIFSRLISGFMCGLFTGVGPLYLSEISPRNLRGASGTLHQLSIVTGILLTNTMGLPSILGNKHLWPCLFAFMLLPNVVNFIFLPFCVETPKYVYLAQHNVENARIILKKLRGSFDEEAIKQEIDELDAEKKIQSNTKYVSFREFLLNEKLRKALTVAIVIQLAQQFSGISSIAVYSTNVFISIGLDAETWAIYATIIIGVFKVFLTIGCLLLIEISGRRKLLIVGFSGMVFFCFPLAIFPVLSTYLDLPWLRYTIVLFALCYVISFSIGPGAIPWLYTSELFPSDSRGRATSLAVFVNWLSNFVVSTSIPLVMESIHSYIYLIFAFFTIISIKFIYHKAPETKNRSIEEVQEFFQ